MGVTIHFEGQLKSDKDFDNVMIKANFFANSNDMPYDSISEPLKKLGRVKNEMGWDYEGPTKGVKIQPDQNSDPLWIEFDKDNYIQEYCKTQFAGIDVHCTKPTDMNGISSVADGINHAVPTHKELQTSIAWLTKNGLIVKQGRNYELTDTGKLEYKAASEHTKKLLEMWEVIEKNLSSYNDN